MKPSAKSCKANGQTGPLKGGTEPRLTKRRPASYIGFFMVLFVPFVPAIYFIGSSISFFVQNANAPTKLLFWPTNTQYLEIAAAGRLGSVKNYNLFSSNSVSIVCLLWSVVSILYGVTHLEQRDRYRAIIETSKGMSYSRAIFTYLLIGVTSIFLSTKQGSYELVSEMLPKSAMSPHTFLMSTSFLYAGGVWFSTEGLLLLIWWLTRLRDARLE